MKRTVLAALVPGLLAVPVALVLAAPAEAAACSDSSGVTVVVQFPDRTEIGCAPGDPSTGYAALKAAGFTITYAQGNGAGALCKINGAPSDAVCGSMPPANAYWAYFHAQRGGAWSYSSTGGGSYNPKPGTVEGWRFGSGAAPSTPPPGAVTSPTPPPSSTPKPAPSATRPPSSGTTGGSVPGTAATSGASIPGGTTTSRPAAGATAGPTAGPTGGPTDGPTPNSTAAGQAPGETPDLGEPTTVTGLPATDTTALEATSSAGISWVWGVGLLAVLGTIGGVVAIRRRG